MQHEPPLAPPPSTSASCQPKKSLHRPGSLSLSIAVGIATRGRPAILKDTLQDLSGQQRLPDTIVVAYTEQADIEDAILGDLRAHFAEVTFLLSPAGLTRQRNTILRALLEFDIVTFLDDDFYLRPDYLQRIEAAFRDDPALAVATGKVLADGILGTGLTLADARRVLRSSPQQDAAAAPRPVFNAYGCNMSLRLLPIRTHGLSFDEALPLYGWYEDVDFSRQLAPYGRIMQIPSACGVHLGVKSGRQSGVRLGYSQVANPVYLARKRSVSWTYAIASMSSRSLKNLVRCLHPEPFVDRRGRLHGNLKAWRDLLSGSIHPTRILEL